MAPALVSLPPARSAALSDSWISFSISQLQRLYFPTLGQLAEVFVRLPAPLGAALRATKGFTPNAGTVGAETPTHASTHQQPKLGGVGSLLSPPWVQDLAVLGQTLPAAGPAHPLLHG